MAAGPGEPDLLSSDEPSSHVAGGSTSRGDRLAGVGAKSAALTTAVSLVLVGGVVTAAVRGSSDSGSPSASLVPAAAFAFAEADLSLHGGQSDALSALLGHFPTIRGKLGSSGSLRERLLRAMFKASNNPHVDYAHDIKPWLGDHVAVAGWVDSGKPEVEFLLQSTDDGAARRSLNKLSPKAGLTFSHGFAVLSTTQRAADDAVRAAQKSSLSDATDYRSDIAALGGAQILTGWLDGEKAGNAISSLLHGASPLGMVPFGSGIASGAFTSAKGRVVLGVRAADNYAEVVAQQVSGPVTATGQQPAGLLTHLPDRTLAAVEITQPQKVVSSLLSVAGMFLGAAGSFSSTPGALAMPPSYGSSVAVGRGYSSYSSSGSGAYGSTLTITPSQPTITPVRPVIVPAHPAQAPAATNPVDAIKKYTGLDLPGDIGTLLGPVAIASYGGLQPGGTPNIALLGHPDQLASARALADRAVDVVRQHAPLDLHVATTAEDLVVATSSGYAAAVAQGGSLGTQQRFATAMGDLPATVGFAAYVDLSSIVPLFSHGQQDLDHLDALGMWAGNTAKGSRFQLRLVVH